VSDVFLSYNREDQAIAQRFAQGFEREGLSVWWMPTLRSGETRRTRQSVTNAWSWLWSPELLPFRQDARFQPFVTSLGLMKYWEKYGPPDSCDLKAASSPAGDRRGVEPLSGSLMEGEKYSSGVLLPNTAPGRTYARATAASDGRGRSMILRKPASRFARIHRRPSQESDTRAIRRSA
jgi:hypothetical protein